MSRNRVGFCGKVHPFVTSRKGRVSRNILSLPPDDVIVVTSRKGRVSRNEIAIQ